MISLTDAIRCPLLPAKGVSVFRALCALRLWMGGFQYDVDERTGIAFWTRPAAPSSAQGGSVQAAGGAQSDALPILFLHGFGVVRPPSRDHPCRAHLLRIVALLSGASTL